MFIKTTLIFFSRTMKEITHLQYVKRKCPEWWYATRQEDIEKLKKFRTASCVSSWRYSYAAK